MMFDVMIRDGFNDRGKAIVSIHRVRDNNLAYFLREQQDLGKYVLSVIPLFKNNKKSNGG